MEITSLKNDSEHLPGAIYGICANLILWLLVTCFLIIESPFSLRILGILTFVTLLWTILWAVGGFLISIISKTSSRPNLTGLGCGAAVGLVIGALLVSWEYCSQPTDPAPQMIVAAVGLPVIIFHGLFFGLFGLENVNMLGLVSSVVLWASFGLSLSRLIKRKRKRIDSANQNDGGKK